MTDKEWMRKLCEREYAVSLIGEIDYSVDFAVRGETARERADRIWKMEKLGEANDKG
jgi:hypothetical protein